MRFRAVITIDLDAPDYVVAGVEQTRIAEIYKNILTDYGKAQLSFRQRRIRGGSGEPMNVRRPSGCVIGYEERPE